ncbi:hypothetical protein MKX01_030058 [Papaver californicum]|nr:hypothetical protein MKX01_030058 [Papaver californicum]
MSHNLIPIAGDTALENLGIGDANTREKIFGDVDVVINFAATTNFYERYDVALSTNTLGPKNILDFCKKCVKLEMLLYVSTAYVCGEKAGVISEEPYKMGETLNRTTTVVDIGVEQKEIEHKLEELRAKQLSKKEETKAMKELGLQRFEQNTTSFFLINRDSQCAKCSDNNGYVYVFTKAMGEMLIGEWRENLPIVIIRPTIFMIIYQVGSSNRGPMYSLKLSDYAYNYFSKNPLMSKNGKPIKVVRPIGLGLMYAILRHDDGGFSKEKERQVKFITQMGKFNEPYLVFKGSFDDSNTEKLRIAVKANEKEENMFYFDPECINWDDYFMNVHPPGLVTYVLN